MQSGGNITQKRVSGQAAIGYGYDTANKDRLISYNGETIGEYDAQGNPWKYRGKTLSWAKRGELTQFGSSYYAYNANGVRTSKNGIKYFYDGHRLIKEEHTDYSLWFFYDERGIAGFTKSANANSVTSSDTSYYYRKNAEGDITHLYSQGGDLLARYEYNAWGEVRVYNRNGSDITEESNYANEIGRINPIRYRGYYYDEDTKLYYLINRYYDPEVGRFINADDIAYLSPFILGGVNLFAYCNNNPVMNIDPEGNFFLSWLVALLVVAVVVDTVVETTILMTDEQYKAENVITKDENGNITNVQIKNSAAFNNPIAQYVYSNYLYNNVKNDDGTNYFTGDVYDIIGEWQAHNFAAMVTGAGAAISFLPSLLTSNGSLFKTLSDLHKSSVHVDLGNSIDAESRWIVRAFSQFYKWNNKIRSWNILNW